MFTGLAVFVAAWAVRSVAEDEFTELHGYDAAPPVTNTPHSYQRYRPLPSHALSQAFRKKQSALERARRHADLWFYAMCGQAAVIVIVGGVVCGYPVQVRPDTRDFVRDTEPVLSAFAFLVLLTAAVSVVVELANHSSPDKWTPSSRLLWRAGLSEGLWAIVVTVMVLWLGFRRKHPKLTTERRAVVWCVSLSAVGLMVFIGHLYGQLLRDALNLPLNEISVNLFDNRDLLPVWFLMICVVPPVIEELFFRYLMLDSLRGVVGVNFAVVLTAILFSLAHFGAPFAMPILFILGLLLGYARVVSGSITLPIVLHFVYNTAGFFIAWYRHSGVL